MPRNLEFKAKVRELKPLERMFIDHGAVFTEILNQTDTYFCVQKGRLKLRETINKKPELIFYERDESSAIGMQSGYDIMDLPDLALKQFLVQSLGVKVVVEKERRLLKMENARIHLDQVKGLGEFMEFEVVYGGDDVEDVELLDKLKKLSALFVIEEINRSYCDMMDRN